MAEVGNTSEPAPEQAVLQPPLEVDNELDDEGYAETTTTSYVTSIASSVRRGVEENGRLYPAMETQHLAAVPVDDLEASHVFFLTNELRRLIFARWTGTTCSTANSTSFWVGAYIFHPSATNQATY